MIGCPHVVTLGVRERVVKPATEFTGSFAMGRISQLPIDTTPARTRPVRQLFVAAMVSIGAIVLAGLPVEAGSTSAQFRISARVIKSCKVSADALASKDANTGGTIKVNCQNSTPSAGSASGAALPSGTATVNYSVDEVPGSDGAVKIVTVNY